MKKIKTQLICLVLFFLWQIVDGYTADVLIQKYPVEVSFLVADLKYSASNGVKICEIQHGILSTFFGDRFSYGEEGMVVPNFIQTIKQIPGPYWICVSHFADWALKKSIKNQKWKMIDSLDDLEGDPFFLINALKPLKNLSDISSYHGLVYVKQSQVNDLDSFKSKYPGVIWVDAAAGEYWGDKYKMSLLFNENETLAKFKPRWNLYPKAYTPELASQIIEDLRCNRFVIKPRNQYKGTGVVIVEKDDLDELLNHILHRTTELRHDPDINKRFWYKTNASDFLVEEFAHSDPVSVSHLDNRLYEPTIRVAFFLIYNNNSTHIEFCGGYLRLPSLSLEEPGFLTNKYKDAVKDPFYAKIDPNVYERVKEELLIALPLLHEQMLNFSKD